MSPVIERALLLWPLLSSEVLLFGTTVFVLAVAPGTHDDRRALDRTFTAVWRVLALIVLLTSMLGLVATTSEMAEVSLRDALSSRLLSEVVQGTHMGQMWAGRIVLAVVVSIFAFFSEGSLGTMAMALGTTAILLLGSLSSHAIDGGSFAVAVYFGHQIAAGLWIGVLSGLWLGFVRADLGDAWVADVAARVSRIAAYSVGALIVTGIFNAYEGIGMMLDHLFYSAYGRVLLIKLALFAIVAAIGGYNRFILMPAIGERSPQELLLRNVAMETVLLIGVLGVTALLSNTPPARHH